MADGGVTPGHLLLAEYGQLKDEQRARIGFRDNLIYATLGSMAAVVAAALTSRGGAGLLLLLPPVCLVLGWTYLVNDEKVSAIGRYLRRTLAPRMASLTGASGVFGWELAHRSDPDRVLRKYGQLVVDLGTFCLSALAALVVYWAAAPQHAVLTVVSIAEVPMVLALGVQFVRCADLARGD